MTMQSIADVVTQAHAEEVPPDVLTARLIAREDEFALAFHMAGAQFGMFPEIIAEVFAELHFGSPITQEQRAMVHNQFVALMNRLAAEHGGFSN
jgi:hypothetical protein